MNKILIKQISKKRIKQYSSKNTLDYYNKHYNSFKEFKVDLEKNIKEGLKDIEEGKCMPAIDFFNEMEEKYSLK